jgi:hypothetical protein
LRVAGSHWEKHGGEQEVLHGDTRIAKISSIAKIGKPTPRPEKNKNICHRSTAAGREVNLLCFR